MSNQYNLCSQICKRFSIDTVGAINRISSAYSIIWQPRSKAHKLPTSSIYTVNNSGAKTEPCLTPKDIWNRNDQVAHHFTQVEQSDNQFSNINNSSLGISFFISMMYNAWWFTLSKALLRSIAHILPCDATHRPKRGFWLCAVSVRLSRVRHVRVLCRNE